MDEVTKHFALRSMQNEKVIVCHNNTPLIVFCIIMVFLYLYEKRRCDCKTANQSHVQQPQLREAFQSLELNPY